MDRNNNREDQDRDQYQNRNRRADEDQYRGAYRLDNRNYDEENRRESDYDKRGASYPGRYGYPSYNEDRSDSPRWQGSNRDYGRDPQRRGDHFDRHNVFPSEDNSGLGAAARNYGNMGSYGGAQGYGSSSNGYGQGRGSQGSQFNSGHGRQDPRSSQQPKREFYGAYRDHNSFAPGEREQYDGAGRYGTQGADNSRGWEPSGRAGSRGGVRDIGTNDISRRGDDSRYEIYDTARSQYNSGMYSTPMNGGYMSTGYDRSREGENYQKYNQLDRSHFNQQGEGRRSEDYGNNAGSLSYGYGGNFRENDGRERNYDPMSGHVRGQGSQSDQSRNDDFAF